MIEYESGENNNNCSEKELATKKFQKSNLFLGKSVSRREIPSGWKSGKLNGIDGSSPKIDVDLYNVTSSIDISSLTEDKKMMKHYHYHPILRQLGNFQFSDFALGESSGEEEKSITASVCHHQIESFQVDFSFFSGLKLYETEEGKEGKEEVEKIENDTETSTSHIWKLIDPCQWNLLEIWKKEVNHYLSVNSLSFRNRLLSTKEKDEIKWIIENGTPSCKFLGQLLGSPIASTFQSFLGPQDLVNLESVHHTFSEKGQVLWRNNCENFFHTSRVNSYSRAQLFSSTARVSERKEKKFLLYPSIKDVDENSDSDRQQHLLWKRFAFFLRCAGDEKLWPIIKLVDFPFLDADENVEDHNLLKKVCYSDSQNVNTVIKLTYSDKNVNGTNPKIRAQESPQKNDREKYRYILKTGNCATISPEYSKSHRAKKLKGKGKYNYQVFKKLSLD